MSHPGEAETTVSTAFLLSIHVITSDASSRYVSFSLSVNLFAEWFDYTNDSYKKNLPMRRR